MAFANNRSVKQEIFKANLSSAVSCRPYVCFLYFNIYIMILLVGFLLRAGENNNVNYKMNLATV